MKKIALPKSKAKTAYGLLSEIRKLILAEPKRYNQNMWRARGYTNETDYGVPRGFPSCGTVGCVAGWVATLKTPKSPYVVGNAYAVLGLTAEQSDELFDSGGAGDDAPQTVRHAKRGAAHIRRFQRKYAAQLKAKAV